MMLVTLWTHRTSAYFFLSQSRNKNIGVKKTDFGLRFDLEV